MSDEVRLERQGPIALVRLNRPEKLNALNSDMFVALNEAISHFAVSPGLRAIVISGEGRGFCAGLDRTAIAAGGSGFALDKREYGPANVVQQVAWGWRMLPMPVIAAVHGVAFGGGLQLMSGADIRIGHAATRLSIRETLWGLVPDMAGIALWKGLVRDDILRTYTYTADEFNGVEGERYGFLTRLDEDPFAAAMRLATAIADRSPDAIRAAKRLFNLAPDSDAMTILAAETDEQLRLKGTANQQEAVRAQLDRRRPHFSD